jgi:hypothetical protein
MGLTHIAFPTFILEPRSVLQRFSDWKFHTAIFRQILLEKNPVIWCLHLCTWLLFGFHIGPRGPKKPYTALLGEVFQDALNHDNCQVSHQPPVSAFYYSDQVGGISILDRCRVAFSVLWKFTVYVDASREFPDYVGMPCPEWKLWFHFLWFLRTEVFIRPLVSEIVGTMKVRCTQSGIAARI